MNAVQEAISLLLKVNRVSEKIKDFFTAATANKHWLFFYFKNYNLIKNNT